ncbi:hypothetical protein [Streptomyces sp. NPDC001781]
MAERAARDTEPTHTGARHCRAHAGPWLITRLTERGSPAATGRAGPGEKGGQRVAGVDGDDAKADRGDGAAAKTPKGGTSREGSAALAKDS